MADITDVFNALKSAIIACLYPPTAAVGGTVTTGDVLTLTATSAVGMTIAGSYTVQVGDTTTTIATALATAITNAAGLMGPLNATASGTTITFGNATGAWTVVGSVTGTETLTITQVPTSGVSPIANIKVEVASGEPLASDLDAIAATTTRALVSIFEAPSYWRNTTRYFEEWQTSVQPTHTLTATVDTTGTIVTIGGTVSTTQNIALIVGFGGAAKPYVYQVKATDTLNSIASALAALVNADTPASASGAAITISAAHKLIARVGGVGTVVKEEMRQTTRIFVNFWCPNPTIRDAVSKPVKNALCETHFLLLADGFAARLITCGDLLNDESEKPGLYRRLVMYDIEYPTTLSSPATEIIVPQLQQTGAAGLPIGTGGLATITTTY